VLRGQPRDAAWWQVKLIGRIYLRLWILLQLRLAERFKPNGSHLYAVFDWFYHTCPRCRVRSRKNIARNELKSSDSIEAPKTSWSRSGNVEIKESYTVWLHNYEVEHVCNNCGHRWVERVTKQRPW
jgi:predicted RNA-binding Zn-ribbon protein involved in translation (DUF1610 family)